MTTTTASDTLYTLAAGGVCLNCNRPHPTWQCPEIAAALLPRIATYRAADWTEAHTILRQITEGKYTLGSGAQYMQPYAAFTMDAHQSGMGYEVFRCKWGQLAGLVAYIRLV